MKIKPNDQQLTVIALISYAVIMISLILIYRDFMITVTSVTIMIVLLFQYLVPILRERKEQKAKDVPGSEGE